MIVSACSGYNKTYNKLTKIPRKKSSIRHVPRVSQA